MIHQRIMTLTAGTRLRHYDLVSALGACGMGEVYRARDVRVPGRSLRNDWQYLADDTGANRCALTGLIFSSWPS